MDGWKTWTAAIGSVLWGIGGWLTNVHDADAAVTMILAGMGLIGLGHKLDKIRQ